MRLSEAIRLGALLMPQHFGATANFDDRGKIIATCAIGAAMQAGYYFGRAESRRFCEKVWCEDPADSQEVPTSVIGMIARLNDHYRWTREAIADWVETVEATDEPALPIPAVDPPARSTGNPTPRVETSSSSVSSVLLLEAV